MLFGRGIGVYYPHNNKFDLKIKPILSQMDILRTFSQINNNKYLVAGQHGVFHYFLKENKLISKTNDNVLHLSKYKNNLYILGLQNDGLKIIDENGNNTNLIPYWPFKSNTRNIFSTFYHNEIIWAGTGNGIVSFNPEKKIFKIYNPRVLPATKEYNTPGIQFIDSQHIAFVNTKGISLLDISKPYQKSKTQQIIFIDKLEYFDFNWRPSKTQVYNEFIQVDLPKGTKLFRFSVGVSDFAFPQFYEARYKIKNQNANWINIEPFQFVNLTLLNPGEYTVEIQLLNMKEGFKSKTVFLKIQIQEYFYQTLLFKLVIILIIVLLIFVFVRYRIINNKKLFISKQALKLSQIKSLNAQLNPHFIANILTLLQEKIINNNKNEAIKIIGEYGALMRKKFDYSKYDFISIAEEINFLKSYIEVSKTIFDETFQYQIIVDERINKHEIKIPIDFIQPFIENVFKHAWKLYSKEKKSLVIEFKMNQEKIIIDILDNGIGIKNNNAFKGGLDNIKKRIELYKEFYETEFNFEIYSLIIGTQVTITFNFNKKT